jgi:hypothetical protein
MKTFLTGILIAFAFCSCQNISDSNHKISTEVLDTIKSSPKGSVASPVYFETAFVKGTTKKANGSTINFFAITIGKVKITSGQIIICDPLHIDEYGIPFTQAFPTGEFPVQLSVLRMGEEESLAFARINFSDEPVVKWEKALRPKPAEIPFGGEDIPEYCVDGGVAAFLDKDAAKALDPKSVADYDGAVFEEMYKHHHLGWRYAMYNFGQHNLAAFTTGLGDGCYPTYIGFDANGKPCRLLTDFGLFDARGK